MVNQRWSELRITTENLDDTGRKDKVGDLDHLKCGVTGIISV